MTFADKLIRLRKKNGMSQEDLADKLGVSRQAISKWEGMLSVPDLQNVLKISDLFNVSTDYLLKDSIVEESACAAGVAERDREARARAVADFSENEEEEEFFETGRSDTGADAVVEEKNRRQTALHRGHIDNHKRDPVIGIDNLRCCVRGEIRVHQFS